MPDLKGKWVIAIEDFMFQMQILLAEWLYSPWDLMEYDLYKYNSLRLVQKIEEIDKELDNEYPIENESNFPMIEVEKE